ncbi:unnamed protein product, partial [Brachionus calyciflorus]
MSYLSKNKRKNDSNTRQFWKRLCKKELSLNEIDFHFNASNTRLFFGKLQFDEERKMIR